MATISINYTVRENPNENCVWHVRCRKSKYLITRVMPQPKIKIQDSPRSHTLPRVRIQDPSRSHAETKFQDPGYPGSHDKAKWQDPRSFRIPCKTKTKRSEIPCKNKISGSRIPCKTETSGSKISQDPMGKNSGSKIPRAKTAQDPRSPRIPCRNWNRRIQDLPESYTKTKLYDTRSHRISLSR